jgi:hypothetical protein
MNGKLLVLLALPALPAQPTLPVERVALGAIQLALGETTFDQIAQRLGPTEIAHTGDAGESRYQACYRSPGSPSVAYYLESDAMGGGQRITQFEAIAAGSGTAAEDSILARNCRMLTEAMRARTDRGVELGLRRSEVERRLGGRGRDSSGVVIYSASEVRRAKAFRATAWSVLRLRYSAGRLVAFAAATGITD